MYFNCTPACSSRLSVRMQHLLSSAHGLLSILCTSSICASSRHCICVSGTVFFVCLFVYYHFNQLTSKFQPKGVKHKHHWRASIKEGKTQWWDSRKLRVPPKRKLHLRDNIKNTLLKLWIHWIWWLILQTCFTTWRPSAMQRQAFGGKKKMNTKNKSNYWRLIFN